MAYNPPTNTANTVFRVISLKIGNLTNSTANHTIAINTPNKDPKSSFQLSKFFTFLYKDFIFNVNLNRWGESNKNMFSNHLTT